MSDAPIDRDLFCRGCGYNLRGLLPTSACPECAMDVASSLVPSSLSLNEAKHFRLADVGALMILAICCWEIASKAGWILKHFYAAPGPALWAIDLICAHPGMMVLISLLQVVALFAFSALARSQFRTVLLVLGMLLCAMEIPFGFGNLWDKETTPLAEAFIAIVFYPQWLGYAAGMARSAGDNLLARRFALLRWMATAALSLHLIGYLHSANAMNGGDGAMILLSAWMIPLILRLRTALQRITPSDDTGGAPVPAPKLPPPDSALQDERWLWRLHAGLVMECMLFGVVLIFPVFAFVNSRLESLGLPVISAPEIAPSYSRATIGMVLFVLLGAAQLVSIWWISSPPRENALSPAAMRQWLRFFAALALAASMVSPIYALLGVGSSAGASGIGLLAHGAVIFLFYLLIENDLAIRAADEDVRRQAAILKWFLPLVFEGLPLILVIARDVGIIGRAAELAMTHLGQMLTIVSIAWAIWLVYWLSRSFARALATTLNTANVI